MKNMIIKAVAALICCMAACWTSIASAQEPVSVSGQVKDTNGNPIIGATVVVERTGAGTTSGVDGAFTISVHPGDELTCVIKQFDRKTGTLEISVKETVPNPFDEASLRHPVGCRRRATIAGKYAGGVFCNLSDGAVVMCRYSFHYEDSDFKTGDTVMVVIQRYDEGKKQIFGKIVGR